MWHLPPTASIPCPPAPPRGHDALPESPPPRRSPPGSGSSAPERRSTRSRGVVLDQWQRGEPLRHKLFEQGPEKLVEARGLVVECGDLGIGCLERGGDVPLLRQRPQGDWHV